MDIANLTPATRPTADVSAAVAQNDTPPVKKSNTVNTPVQIPAVEKLDLRSVDGKRLEDIQSTVVRQSFQDVFAVSDTTFTIFKDSSGQYITRFTSLRDGSVTYIPEPDILKFSGGSSTYFEVHA